MKKILLPLIIFSIIASCSNLKTDKTEFKNDLKIRGLKGRIKSIRTEIFEYKKTKDSFKIGDKLNSYSPFDRDELLEFDEKGFLIKRTEFNTNNEITDQTNYQYNSKSQLKKIIEVENYGKGSTYKKDFFYNTNDSLIKYIISNDSFKRVSIIERDSNNRMVKVQDIVDDTIQMSIIYNYDKYDNLIEENKYLKGNIPVKKITKKYKNKLVQSEIIKEYKKWGDTLKEKKNYSYDSKNRLLLIKSNYIDNKNYTSIQYSYDSNGTLIKQKIELIGNENSTILIQKWDNFSNLIEHSRINKLNEIKETWSYEYKFDNSNNWIKKISFKNQKPLNITLRKVQYWK